MQVQHLEFIMAEQQTISIFASSSNSSSMVSAKKYDVFLSFRGEDTRRNFTSHLYEALMQKKVETYIDYQLEKGDEISPALIKAIEDSLMSIVVFSENYASSKWCLGELSKIVECKNVQGQIVIPIFYDIDPSHVRKQTRSYKKAFAKHKEEPRCNEWKAALTEVANLAGWDSENRIESEFLKDIVEDVLQKLASRNPIQRKGLVGIEKNYEQIESLLKFGSSDVRTLGIWGMGGIGKTTLATTLYDKLSHKFEGRCFLSNVNGKSDKLDDLRDKLFSALLKNKNSNFDTSDMNKLRCKKVFIVLDDVSTSEQLEQLIEEYDFLGPGSKVIVTTRNKQILSSFDEIYPVKELSSHQSLQLFCLTVFGEKQSKDGYEALSRRVISYCKGVPLALKVMGASLRKRSKEAWECELRKLQKIPKLQIHNVLKLSYDGLDRFEKDIFLDIACFFKGERRDWVTVVLEAFDFFPASGIEVLLDKALTTISCENWTRCEHIEMHDLIQEMGWEIVHQESIKDPGRRSRLWKHEEVVDVLKYVTGTDVVEGIMLDLRKLIGDLYFSSDSLAKMTNLRFLQIRHWYTGSNFNVYFPNGLESLSDKLRCIHWDGCSLESFPTNFCAEQLVVLSMPDSKLIKLWDGVQNLVNLKIIQLERSRDLIKIPDLSKAKELEKVSLVGCESLCQLHPSLLSLPKLAYLYLSHCREIGSLKSNDHSKSLRVLRLDGCSSLKELLVASEEMTELDLSDTAICSLSPSMLSLPKLTHLSLRGCREIESVNVHLRSLIELNLYGCSSLKEFSMTSDELTTLDLSCCVEIESLNIHSKSLNVLKINGCSYLKELSVTSEEMTELDLSCTAICALSSSMLTLPKLTYLILSDCRVIESLNIHSKSLHLLELDGCSSLKEISVISKEMRWLNLSDTNICALPSSIVNVLSLEGLELTRSNVESLPANIKNLRVLRRLDLDYCWKLVSLPKLPPSLRELYLNDCWKLVSLPELPPSLEKLSALNCISLKTNTTQGLVLQHMLQSRIPYLHQQYLNNPYYCDVGYFIIPRDHATDESMILTTKSSITIPYLPKSHLCGFSFCIIISEGPFENALASCSIYQDDMQVSWGHRFIGEKYLISDHVLYWYHDVNNFDKVSEVYDHFSHISFIFEFQYYECKQVGRDQQRIKGCGVFPVYATTLGLKLVHSSSKEIFEWKSVTQNL